jgi:hypothetical protein
MIELVHHCLNLVIGYVLKTATFGKVLSNQTIGIFVWAAFQGMIGMSKIDVSGELFLYGFVSCEFFAVICGNR